MHWCSHNTGHRAQRSLRNQTGGLLQLHEEGAGCTLLQHQGLEALHKITQLVSGKLAGREKDRKELGVGREEGQQTGPASIDQGTRTNMELH